VWVFHLTWSLPLASQVVGMHQASDDVFPKDSLESLVKAHEGQAFFFRISWHICISWIDNLNFSIAFVQAG